MSFTASTVLASASRRRASARGARALGRTAIALLIGHLVTRGAGPETADPICSKDDATPASHPRSTGATSSVSASWYNLLVRLLRVRASHRGKVAHLLAVATDGQDAAPP